MTKRAAILPGSPFCLLPFWLTAPLKKFIVVGLTMLPIGGVAMQLRFLSLSTLVAAALSVLPSATVSAQDLRVYCPMSEADCSMVLKSFEEDSGIKSSFTRIGTGEIVARIRAEKNNPQADLWLAGAAESLAHRHLAIFRNREG